MSKKLECDCKSDYQDKKYGKNIRIHNATVKYPSGNPGWRCTVCGKTRV